MTMTPDISRRNFLSRAGMLGGMACLGTAASASLIAPAPVGSCLVAGAGKRGRACLEILQQHAQYSLQIMDSNRGRTRVLVKTHGSIAVPDDESPWEHPAVQRILVATPPSAGSRIAQEAHQLGKPVFADYSDNISLLSLLDDLCIHAHPSDMGLLCFLSPALLSVRNEIAFRQLGTLRLGYACSGGHAPHEIEEQHLRHLLILLSACDPPGTPDVFSTSSGTHPGEKYRPETIMTSISFGNSLRLEVVTSTQSSLKTSLTFRGEKNSLALTELAGLNERISLSETREILLQDWIACPPYPHNVACAVPKHARLLAVILAQSRARFFRALPARPALRA